jgi:hypothetical protein
MRNIDVRGATRRIASPIGNAYINFTKMTTSLVATVTDVVRDDRTVIGYGFNSKSSYGQRALIRNRFAPRLLAADPATLQSENGANLDPDRVWACLMIGRQRKLPGFVSSQRRVPTRDLG